MSEQPPVSSRAVGAERLQACNAAPICGDGRYVLYWMTALRRAGWNFSLDRSVELAKALNKPLLVVETLASGCRWASDRHHAFVIGGMADNARRVYRGRGELLSARGTPVRLCPRTGDRPGRDRLRRGDRRLPDSLDCRRLAGGRRKDRRARGARRFQRALARAGGPPEFSRAPTHSDATCKRRFWISCFRPRRQIPSPEIGSPNWAPCPTASAGAGRRSNLASWRAIGRAWRGCRSITRLAWPRWLAAAARPTSGWGIFSTTACRATMPIATSRKSMRPAGCRRTCISDIFRRTKCFARWRPGRTGRRTRSTPRSPARRPVGGACRNRPRPCSTN